MHTTHTLRHPRRRALRSAAAWLAMLVVGAVAASPAAAVPPSDWADRGSGCFSTWDYVDYVCYEVRPDAVSQEIVSFRLEDYNRRHWRKTIVMPDGLGSEWPIWVDASRRRYTDENSLWAGQVHNGQRLRFYKAGTFGIDAHVMYLGGLERLEPGTQVVFRWLRDSDDH